MAKFLDKTMDEWDDMAEEWHNDPTIELSLREYMELNEIEYLRYVHNITNPNLTDEQVIEEAGRRTREAVVGLTAMEVLENIDAILEEIEI